MRLPEDIENGREGVMHLKYVSLQVENMNRNAFVIRTVVIINLQISIVSTQRLGRIYCVLV
jgi:hypothetical protein